MRQFYLILLALGAILPLSFVKADGDSTPNKVITRQDVGTSDLTVSDVASLTVFDKMVLKALNSPRLQHLTIKFIGFADSMAPEIETFLDKIQPALRKFFRDDAAGAVQTGLRMFPKALILAEHELDEAIAARRLPKTGAKSIVPALDITPKSDLKAK